LQNIGTLFENVGQNREGGETSRTSGFLVLEYIFCLHTILAYCLLVLFATDCCKRYFL